MWGSMSSSDMILKDANGVEPGWVEIIPLNRVTLHVRTWLYSEHTAHKATHYATMLFSLWYPTTPLNHIMLQVPVSCILCQDIFIN